jgi:hypothetical protein
VTGLAEFLLERIAEDRGPSGIGHYIHCDGDYYITEMVINRATADHIARWHPLRVLADCDARRRLVEELARMQRDEFGWDNVEDKVMSYLALPYADHPDFQDEWRL